MTSDAHRLTDITDLQHDALLGIDLDEDRFANSRTQRRVLPRQDSASTDADLEINRFSEKDLLTHMALPDVIARRPGLGQLDVLGPHRERHALVGPKRLRRGDLDVADVGADGIAAVG